MPVASVIHGVTRSMLYTVSAAPNWPPQSLLLLIITLTRDGIGTDRRSIPISTSSFPYLPRRIFQRRCQTQTKLAFPTSRSRLNKASNHVRSRATGTYSNYNLVGNNRDYFRFIGTLLIRMQYGCTRARQDARPPSCFLREFYVG